MKKYAVMIVAVLLACMSAMGQSNDCCVVLGSNWTEFIDVSYAVVIGPVTIDGTDGSVTIVDGVTMDAASREFWDGLAHFWPGHYQKSTEEPKTNLTFETSQSTDHVSAQFKDGFAAGVQWGILSYMQHPEEDDVNFHIAEAQKWYWLIVVDKGKAIIDAARESDTQ